MSLTIDLRAKIVDDSASAWRIFPGYGYAFREDFVKHSLVYLDMPELTLPEGVVSRDYEWVNEVVKRAEAFNRYYIDLHKFFKEKTDAAPPDRPSSDLEFYRDASKGTRTSYGVTAIVALFGEAKAGDLLLMPSPPGERKVYIGEFVNTPHTRQSHTIEYENYNFTTLARRVRWLTVIDEWRLPKTLYQSLRHQIPISSINSEFFVDILELAYRSFIVTSSTRGARIDTKAAEFSDQDNLDLGLLIKLSATIAWNDFTDHEQDEVFNDYIQRLLPDEAALSIRSNINSPGSIFFKGITHGPLLLTVLFAIGLNSDSQKSLGHDIKVINSQGSKADKHAKIIEEQVNRAMKHLGEEEANEFVARCQRLAENPKIQVAACLVGSR